MNDALTEMNDALTRIRINYARRYRRRLFWRRLRWALGDAMRALGMLIATMLVIVAWSGAIAILCGY